MNKISTKLVKVDLKTILDNYREPEFWSKTWLIYKRPQFEITMKIEEISIYGNQIIFDVFLNTTPKFTNKYTNKSIAIFENHYFQAACVCIPINNKEFTQNIFENLVLSACLKKLKEIEGALTCESSDYKKADDLENLSRNKLRKIAVNFLNKNNIINVNIRNGYIDSYVNEYAEDLTSKIFENNYYKLIPEEYLILASYFNNDKKFAEIKEKCSGIKEDYAKKLYSIGKKLNSPKYAKEMEGKLNEL